MEDCVRRKYVIDINDLCDLICIQVGIGRDQVFHELCNLHTYAMDRTYVEVSEQDLKELISSGWTEDDQFILEQVTPANDFEIVLTEVLHLIDEMKIPEEFILLINW